MPFCSRILWTAEIGWYTGSFSPEETAGNACTMMAKRAVSESQGKTNSQPLLQIGSRRGAVGNLDLVRTVFGRGLGDIAFVTTSDHCGVPAPILADIGAQREPWEHTILDATAILHSRLENTPAIKRRYAA